MILFSEDRLIWEDGVNLNQYKHVDVTGQFRLTWWELMTSLEDATFNCMYKLTLNVNGLTEVDLAYDLYSRKVNINVKRLIPI